MCVVVHGALSVKRTGHAEFFPEIKDYFHLKLILEIDWIKTCCSFKFIKMDRFVTIKP